MNQLIVTRAVVLMFFVLLVLLCAAIAVSEFINRGNDMTEDEDFADMVARAEATS